MQPYAEHLRKAVLHDTVIQISREKLRHAWPPDSDFAEGRIKRDVRISYKMWNTIVRDLEEEGIGIAFGPAGLGKQGQKFFVLYDKQRLKRRESVPDQAKAFLDRLRKDPRLYEELGIAGLRAKLTALNEFIEQFPV